MNVDNVTTKNAQGTYYHYHLYGITFPNEVYGVGATNGHGVATDNVMFTMTGVGTAGLYASLFIENSTGKCISSRMIRCMFIAVGY